MGFSPTIRARQTIGHPEPIQDAAAENPHDQQHHIALFSDSRSAIVETSVVRRMHVGSDDYALTAAPAGYEVAKRAVDLVLGACLFLIAIPLISIGALWIWAESAGSPFFFQIRLGRRGKPFHIFKLRGMFIDARDRFPHLYDYSGNRDLEFHFHYKDDPRVTRAGRFLRRTSIDELPNLWNVLKGDMSLVGPRPEIPEILEMYGSYRVKYLSVKPGISCLSKCSGRDHLTKRESIELDLQYIRDRSFFMDLKILWKTFVSVISRRNVY